MNAYGVRHGRGIRIFSDGDIFIGYYDRDGFTAPGTNYINILSCGNVDVGQIYMKDGKRWNKWTRYFTDGATKEFDKAV